MTRLTPSGCNSAVKTQMSPVLFFQKLRVMPGDTKDKLKHVFQDRNEKRLKIWAFI